MKPRNATIGGPLICAGAGLGMALFFGWVILRHFPSTDWGEPFRQRATHFNQPAVNFAVFSAFVLQMAMDAAFFFLGMTVVVVVAFKATKYLWPASR